MPDAGRLLELDIPSPDGTAQRPLVTAQVPSGELWYIEQGFYLIKQSGQEPNDYDLDVFIGVQPERLGNVPDFPKPRVESFLGSNTQQQMSGGRGDVFDLQTESANYTSIGRYLYENEVVVVSENIVSEPSDVELALVLQGRRVLP